jgi:hypothetical protein
MQCKRWYHWSTRVYNPRRSSRSDSNRNTSNDCILPQLPFFGVVYMIAIIYCAFKRGQRKNIQFNVKHTIQFRVQKPANINIISEEITTSIFCFIIIIRRLLKKTELGAFSSREIEHGVCGHQPQEWLIPS